MNKKGMLIMHPIKVTSIGNNRKHTFTIQKKGNFKAVLDIGIFSPKYQNIGHRKFYANRLTLF